MAQTSKLWKRGRGKLGLLAPLIGNWTANASTPMGSVTCTRTFESVLGGNYVRLIVRWEFEKGVYQEIAMFGVNADGKIAFWSFTSDGKNSNGIVADVTDIHPEAIGFEAHMPAGLARMAYWPDDSDGFHWSVEAKNKKGVEEIHRASLSASLTISDFRLPIADCRLIQWTVPESTIANQNRAIANQNRAIDNRQSAITNRQSAIGNRQSTMESYSLTVDSAPKSEDVEVLVRGLNDHSVSYTQVAGFREIAVFLRDEQGALVGGVWGYVNWNWLWLGAVWLSDSLRGAGHGRRMIEAFEQAGRDRGCRYSHLDTFSFQARPFYEGLGYEVFATLDDYPPGHQRFFMKKALI